MKVKLSPVIAGEWFAGSELHKARPGFGEVFMPRGAAPVAGELFRNPALARTMRDVAAKGRAFTRRGRFAEAITTYQAALAEETTSEVVFDAWIGIARAHAYGTKDHGAAEHRFIDW